MAPVNLIDRAILRIKRGETPLTGFLKRCARSFYNPTVPRIPAFLKPPLRFLYECEFLIISARRWLSTVLFRNPMFQARCASFGRRVSVGGLPFVSGHVQIHVGDDVKLGGGISIFSGRIFDEPRLILKDRCELGWNTQLTVNKEVLIEEDARVSFDCRISDSDGHPPQADLRAAGLPPDRKDIRPVRICRNAWIGNGTHIMKGVTIGEGAIVGANSVVMSNVPAYSLAVGNPAEILFRNVGLPSTAPRGGSPPSKDNAASA